MPRTISRGGVYWLDRQRVAEAIARGVPLPPPPTTPPDPEGRMDLTHPMLLVQSVELSGTRSFCIAVGLTTLREEDRVKFLRKRWAVILEADDVQAIDRRARVAKCNQIFTMETDCLANLLGTVTPAAMKKVDEGLARVLGLRDP